LNGDIRRGGPQFVAGVGVDLALASIAVVGKFAKLLGVQKAAPLIKSHLPEYLYHYTSKSAAAAIEGSQFLGLEGRTLYLTPSGGLSAIQAEIELALPSTGGALFRVPTSVLEGGSIVRAGRVTGDVYGRGGGGIEILYNGRVPIEFVERVR